MKINKKVVFLVIVGFILSACTTQKGLFPENSNRNSCVKHQMEREKRQGFVE